MFVANVEVSGDVIMCIGASGCSWLWFVGELQLLPTKML